MKQGPSSLYRVYARHDIEHDTQCDQSHLQCRTSMCVSEWVSEQCDQTDYRRLLSIGTAARSNEPNRNETETETEKKRNGTERYGTERNAVERTSAQPTVVAFT